MKLVGLKRSLVAILPRKFLKYCGVIIVLVLFIFLLFHFVDKNATFNNIYEMKLLDQNLEIHHLKSLIRAQDDFIDNFSDKGLRLTNVTRPMDDIYLTGNISEPSAWLPHKVAVLINNISGTRTAAGFQRKDTHSYYPVYLNQLMPHMTRQPRTLKPAFLMSAGRRFADVVIGIPTVKRDTESYLMATLQNLVENLLKEEVNSTLIVVSIGESDPSFILNTALEIEYKFSAQLDSGLIDVIAPAPSYYPNLEMIPPTLDDSEMRHQWRTKQNLDVIFTMAYAYSKGRFYLMLEDDVLTSRGYISIILNKIKKLSVLYPRWIVIHFGGSVTGFGNVFRSANLIHLISYLQLFYAHMPIDYLIQSYVDNLVCTPFMKADHCMLYRQRASIKEFNIFKHIGTYSSLNGKMHRVKNPIAESKLFFPHVNPPVSQIVCTIVSYKNNTIGNAYNGLNYFWGKEQNFNDFIRFDFKIPTFVESIKFRSGNGLHIFDTIRHASVEIKLARNYSDDRFIPITHFDELGFAHATLPRSMGHLEALRIHFLRKSEQWIVISERFLKIISAPLLAVKRPNSGSIQNNLNFGTMM